jgi:hypothetical protein
MNEFCNPLGATSHRDDRLYLWTMYAEPGLAVRFDEVPGARARLGHGSRRGGRGLGRGAVGRPRFHRAAHCGSGKDRCSNDAELRHGSPCLDVDDPDLENDVCKMEAAEYAAMEQIPIPCGARATVFAGKLRELDVPVVPPLNFLECWFLSCQTHSVTTRYAASRA